MISNLIYEPHTILISYFIELINIWKKKNKMRDLTNRSIGGVT